MSADPPCVLVVEDDDDLRDALAEAVVAAGFGVAVAAGQREALDVAQARAPAVLLLDATLPDGSAADLVRTLRRSVPVLPSVVLLTGSLVDRAAVAEVAPARILYKPASGEAILDALRAAMAAR